MLQKAVPVKMYSDGSSLVVEYQIDATDGVWDTEDNGTFDIVLNDGQIADFKW